MSLNFKALVLLVCLAPIPFGSIYRWAWGLEICLVAILLAIWGFRAAFVEKTIAVPPRALALTIGTFSAVLLWVVIQISPYSPASWHAAIWSETVATLGIAYKGSISIAPTESSEAAFRLAGYAAIFWLAVQYGRRTANVEFALKAICIAATLYAAYGLTVLMAGWETILWYPKERYAESVTGPFRYKNGFATYAGIAIVTLLALYISFISRASAGAAGPRERRTLVLNAVFEKGWPYLIGIIILITALVYSNSRAGFISAIIGVGILVSVMNLSKQKARMGKLALLAIFVVGGIFVAFAFQSGKLGDRFDDIEQGAASRETFYELTKQIIDENKFLGTGYGTYRYAFSPHRPPEFKFRLRRAHSSYLENIAELGIPGAVLYYLMIGSAVFITVLGVRRRQRNTEFPALGVAVSALVGLHAIYDFTMQIPAVTMTFALILGLACAQSWSTSTRIKG